MTCRRSSSTAKATCAGTPTRAAWERLLPDPSRSAARQALRDKLEVAVFTPGEPKGRPLALPVVHPGSTSCRRPTASVRPVRRRALGSMIGFGKSDKDKGQRAILAKAIETLAAVPGATITVPALRELIEQEDDAL